MISLAPTDPALAADVQVTEPRDRDRQRFTLTGEAEHDDGTAFPFVVLGNQVCSVWMTWAHLDDIGWPWMLCGRLPPDC